MFAPFIIYLLTKIHSLTNAIKLFFNPKPPQNEQEEWEALQSRQF